MDEELIMFTLAQRMANVRWTRTGDDEPDQHRFLTISRRVKLFGEVSHEQQPACFQAEHGDAVTQVTDMPYKTILEAKWIVYQCVARDPNALGASENNFILQGIRQALAPTPSDRGWPERNTLNGLVHHCFIQGTIFKDPGDLDGQGMMVIPIKLLVP